jgi:hypothetical protein
MDPMQRHEAPVPRKAAAEAAQVSETLGVQLGPLECVPSVRQFGAASIRPLARHRCARLLACLGLGGRWPERLAARTMPRMLSATRSADWLTSIVLLLFSLKDLLAAQPQDSFEPDRFATERPFLGDDLWR